MKPIWKYLGAFFLGWLVGGGILLILVWQFWNDHKIETRQREFLFAASLLHEFSSVLRGTKETQETTLKDVEVIRMQAMIAGLWELRHASEACEAVALSMRDYLQGKGVKLDAQVAALPPTAPPK